MSDLTHRDALPGGYRLHWYVIDKVLGQGGFGITYLARDENLHQPVAIKEYLPRDLALRQQDDSVQPLSGEQGAQFRWGLERFISEARTLAQFRHSNIVRVLTVFEENNTAYMVMEYEQGQGLHEILNERKTLPQQELERILMPLQDGLEKVHAAGFIHRDIKPANIYIRADGSPVLLDFGSARQALGEQTQTLTSLVSPGYAPFEQYTSKGEERQGPWTDIYGLGATLYRIITGRSPCDAVDRSEALLQTERDDFVPCAGIGRGRYRDVWLRAIDHALAFRPQDRPQNIADWRREFTLPRSEAPTIVATTVVQPKPVKMVVPLSSPAVAAAPQRSRRWLPALIVLAVILVFAKLAHRPRHPHPAAEPSAASTAAPQPASSPGQATAAPAQESKPAMEQPVPASPPEISNQPAQTRDTEPSSESQATDAAAAEDAQGERPNKRELTPAQLEKRREVQQLLTSMKEARQRGDYQSAWRDLQEALKIAPNNPRLLEARRELMQRYKNRQE
jgi:serine/threonine protein kinase